MPKSAGNLLSVSQATEKIRAALGDVTIRTVQREVVRGSFPGARKLDPTKHTSPYLIPEAEVDAFIAERKRAQTHKA